METTRVFAGDCTAVHDRDERSEFRGRVIVVVKADNTVLVHDAEGYQPVAWLTRAESVACERDAGRIVARNGEERLRVLVHDEDGFARYRTSSAGVPVGKCPACGDELVREGGAVACIGCGDRYGLPARATVRDDRCDCGLPRIRVERGVPLDLCLDRSCEPLVEAVAEEFDRVWSCPDCGSDLRILRRGGLLVGCDAYPDCDVSYSFPAGVVVDTCECGLPVFRTPSGRRCLDATCERSTAAEPERTTG
ncbi:MAG: DNA topoisomerase-1 [Halobacteriales archaeon]|jgi:DNA topoisomerase-1